LQAHRERLQRPEPPDVNAPPEPGHQD
jgi:hypothetical protein